MPNTARVLIVGENAARTPSNLSQTLQSHGFISDNVDLATGIVDSNTSTRPDVVVFDLLQADASRQINQFLEFARRLKRESALAHLPIVAIGDDDSCTDSVIDDIRHAQVDEVIVGPVNEHQICGRLNALVRLNTMHEELVRRLTTSAKYGVDAPAVTAPPRELIDATVLVVGATEAFPIIENTLSRHATLIGALTPETALDYLTRRDFDTVILDLGFDPQPYLDLCRQVRRNSRLFNIPIVLLAKQELMEDPQLASCEGVTDIIAKPIRTLELETRIISLISELRFRNSLRSIYQQARHMATSDGLTGLFSRGFLLEHLRIIITQTQERARQFSVAFLEISNIEQINQKFGYVVGDRIIRQVGEMMGLLVRGEDLTARYNNARYCIILPDTSVEAARVAVKRISGVVNCTELTAPDIDGPIKVDLICSVSEYQDDAGPQEMIDRIKSKLS